MLAFKNAACAAHPSKLTNPATMNSRFSSAPRSRRAPLLAVLFIAGLLQAAAAQAAESLADFNAAVARADVHFRTASHYLRVGAADPAMLELDALDLAWQAIVTRFAPAAPPPFASDPAWRDTLRALAARVAAARTAAAAGDLGGARTTLLPLRGELTTLRRRNGVVVFADCLEEIHAALAGYAPFRETAPDLESDAQRRALLATTAVLEHLLRRCRDDAPQEVARDEQFQRLVAGALQGLDRLWAAVEARDVPRVEGNVREILSSVRLLYLGFG